MSKRPLPTSIPRTQRSIETKWGSVVYQAWGLGDQSVILQAIAGDTDQEDVSEHQRVDALEQILENCVVKFKSNSTAQSISESPMFLAEYVLMKLRAISIGEEAEVAKRCSENIDGVACDGRVSFKFNIDKDVVIIEDPDHETSLVMGDYKLNFKYPSIRESLKISEIQALDNISERLSMMFLESIECGEEFWLVSDYTEEEMLAFAKDLGSEVQKFINTKFTATMPHVGVNLKGCCDKCGKQEEFSIKGVSKLFTI